MAELPCPIYDALHAIVQARAADDERFQFETVAALAQLAADVIHTYPTRSPIERQVLTRRVIETFLAAMMQHAAGEGDPR